MCGIVGYVGRRDAAPILLEGLKALEYRGYDSAGIAVLGEGGGVTISKREGKLANLLAALDGGMPAGRTGIGHTRWATHGRPSDVNAHPHTDDGGAVLVIQNGIVENYAALKRELIAKGHRFASDTDTETIPMLVADFLAEGHSLLEAVRRTVNRLEGAHAIVVLSAADPGKMVAARLGNAGGVVIGYGEGEMFLASDLPALLPHTRQVAFLADGELAEVDASGARFLMRDGSPGQAVRREVPFDALAAHKGHYRHFMLKEIVEQPESLADTIRSLATLDPPAILLTDVPDDAALFAGIRRVVLVAMGSSLNAAAVGKRYVERLAGIPAEVENASEFRYATPAVDPETLVVGVTQSGESVETLEAMKLAADGGARLLTVTNIEGSAASRLAEGTIYLRCGLEIGVASTKCFTATIAALLLLACRLGEVEGRAGEGRLAEVVSSLARVPQLVGEALARSGDYARVAQAFSGSRNFLFLGRGLQYPIALEGALKLKEISYIHAEGYAAGEMKHGPIALVDPDFPSLVIALDDGLRDKMISNVQQLKARQGKVVGLINDGDEELAAMLDAVLYAPRCPELVAPIVATVPLQCFAYHIAVRLGLDVDQPRNLAKTVTVE